MFPPVRFRLEVLPECASTQELLLERRGNPRFHGTAVLALRQTAGHGRRGREWTSFDGNLSLSFGLTVPEAQLPLLTFAAGLALFAVTELSLPEVADLRLKWPNDIYLDGKKLGGMLAQGRQVPGAQAEVVIGIGVNLARAPEGLEMPAVALSAYCQPRAPEEFARLFLQALEHVFDEYRTFDHLRADWEEAARLGEGRLTIVGESEPVRAEALLPTGELLVRYEDGRERKLASEEVSIRMMKVSE
jgi:BirA family biotin operon repressor/biotin-[acetyl-CoA-carboxylase] ligase